MDDKKLKVSSIIVANTFVDILKDIIEIDIDKNEKDADPLYVDLMIELNEFLSLFVEMTEKRL